MNNTRKTLSMLSRRRLVGQVFLGGAAALVLTACGGGSDGSDSGGTIDLLDKYNRLEVGMTKAQVTALVGREADDIADTSKQWSEGNQILTVMFNFGDSDVISTADWRQVNPSRSFVRGF